MKLLLQITLCGLLACGVGLAQRGGGGHGGGGGGGFHGGGGMGGGGFHGGGGFGGGGFHGGGFAGGGFRGGYGGYGYRGYGYGYGGYGGYGYGGYGYGWGYPGWGLGIGWGGYWPSDWDYYNAYPYSYPYYSYPYSYAPYGSYGDPPATSYSPGANVIYPQAQPVSTAVYVQPPVRSVTHVYDEYGQEVNTSGGGGGSASSPIYLIAFKDQVIHAATSYRVEGDTLVYQTMQHEEKRAPLSSLDRNFTLQLNRERHVPFNLPQQ